MADLIRRDRKLSSTDQSCCVLHVVKPLIKNTQAHECHMLAGNKAHLFSAKNE